MIVPSSPDWARRLGGTGLLIAPVTVGGTPIGDRAAFLGHEVADEEGVAIVRRVLDSPYLVIDTANTYGGGESERRIGLGIAEAGGLPPGHWIITKTDPADGDYSGERVRASVRESRERLGVDLPLVLLHDPEAFDFDQMTGRGGAVEALVALRDAGEVGHIGLAGGDSRVMSRYWELGYFEVLLVHNRLTLVDRSASDLVDRARADGAGVLNAAVYGGGILADPTKQNYGYRPAKPQVRAAVDAIVEVCARYGTTIEVAALQQSVRDPRVDSTIVGIGRVQRVDELTAALAQDLPDAFWHELESLVPPRVAWLDS